MNDKYSIFYIFVYFWKHCFFKSQTLCCLATLFSYRQDINFVFFDLLEQILGGPNSVQNIFCMSATCLFFLVAILPRFSSKLVKVVFHMRAADFREGK